MGNRIQDNTLWPDGKYSINDRIEERRLRSKNEVGAVAKYGYDKLYRLTNVTRGLKYNHGFGVHDYKFDPVGNRVKYRFDMGNHEYKYNNLNQLTTLFQNFGNGIREYSWDQNGNMSGFANYKIGEKIYKKGEKVSETKCYWDYENRLTGVDFPVVTRIRDEQQMPSMRMKYDTEGNRIVKDTLYGSSLSRRRVYVLGKEEYEIEGTNEYTNVFISGIRINRDGEVEYSHKDVLGSTVFVTDSDAKIVEKTIYDAYGSIAKQETETDNDKLFTGKELDKETGWMYFGARYYDPIVGRWLSRDKVRGEVILPKTLNRYIYCVNNPINYVDPKGNYFMFNTRAAFMKINENHKRQINEQVAMPTQVIVGSGAAVMGAVYLTPVIVKVGSVSITGISAAKGAYIHVCVKSTQVLQKVIPHLPFISTFYKKYNKQMQGVILNSIKGLQHLSKHEKRKLAKEMATQVGFGAKHLVENLIKISTTLKSSDSPNTDKVVLATMAVNKVINIVTEKINESLSNAEQKKDKTEK